MLAVQTKPTRKKEINKPPQPQRWTRPREGLLKANCDCSFFSESKKGGWGFIIRDHQGKALIAGSGSISAVHDVECTEAQAYVAALQAASNQGIPRLILETDSMVTVKALQSDEIDLCPASVLYREARDLISLWFISVQVLHVLRSSNKCAHELAHLSFDWDPDHPHVWFDSLPSFVNGLVVRDSAGPNINE
jgi:ribonuclease HI